MRTRMLFLLLALSSVSLAQCPDYGYTNFYGSAYAMRSGGTVITSTQAYAAGPNSAYAYTTIKQSDTLTNQFNQTSANGQPVTGSANPGYIASTNRYSFVSQVGYGTFQTQGYMTGFLSCNGQSFPPYNVGGPNTNVAGITVIQPLINTTGSKINLQYWYAVNDQGGSVPAYNTYVNWSANANGLPGTPSWTFTGTTGNVNASCTTCGAVTLTASPSATLSCISSVQGYYTQDGLQSRTAYLAVVAPTIFPYTTVHQTVTGGYDSQYRWVVQDQCAVAMPYVVVHEVFPSGFSYSYQGSNWGFPTPDGTNDYFHSLGDGTFVDHIFEFDTTGNTYIPPVLTPQQPLQNLAIYSGTQVFNAIFNGSTLFPIYHPVQVHYQDHGGYIYY